MPLDVYTAVFTYVCMYIIYITSKLHTYLRSSENIKIKLNNQLVYMTLFINMLIDIYKLLAYCPTNFNCCEFFKKSEIEISDLFVILLYFYSN